MILRIVRNMSVVRSATKKADRQGDDRLQCRTKARRYQALISTVRPRFDVSGGGGLASLAFAAEDSLASLSLSPSLSRAAGLACWGGADGGGAEPLEIEVTDMFYISLRQA
jgi:hypothetical protein